LEARRVISEPIAIDKGKREKKPFWGLTCHYLGIASLTMGFAYKAIMLLIRFAFENEFSGMLVPFSISSLAAISLGLTLYVVGGEVRALKLGEALSISALIWLFIPAMGSLPFIISGYLDPLSAYFESMSGFTATGLTMFPTAEVTVENIPQSLLLWRSLTQWIGGVGIIVLFLTILGRESTASRLYSAEGRTDRIRPSVVSTARWVWVIYSLYTVICALLLFAVTMDGFQAVNFSMTAMATGGFAVTDESVASLNSGLAEGIIVVFMIAGATSFVLHYRVLVKGLYNPLRLYRLREGKKAVKERTNRVLVYEFILMMCLAIIGFLIVSCAEGMNFREGIFQSISAVTGTGFSNANVADYKPMSKTILSLLMMAGGCYGSTTSAIKSFRVLLLMFSIAWIVRRKLLPGSAVVPLKVGDKTYRDEDVMDVAVYIFLYFGALIIGTLIFMGSGLELGDSFFEVASAQGNVGLSVGITNVGMAAYQKIVLIIEMWIGRLEIIPIFVLLRRLFPL